MKRIVCFALVFALLCSCAYTPKGYKTYKKGKLVEIHERVGETIDPEEREQYDLFVGVEGFKSAAFYEIPEGGFEAIIETEDGVFCTVNRDPKALEILHDWIDRHYAYQDDEIADEQFIKKWGIADKDTLGFFITKGEISKGKPQYACVGGAGCCLLGFIPGMLLAISVLMSGFNFSNENPKQDEADHTLWAVLAGSFAMGILLGYSSSEGTIKTGIKKARELRKSELSAAVEVTMKSELFVISGKVGEVIDPQEREILGMFRSTKGFKKAVFLQYEDGSYAVEITYEEDGAEKTKTLPQSEEYIEYIRTHIEGCEELPTRE